MPPADVVEAWRALAVAEENPFALPEWLEAWCGAHPDDAPHVVVCRRDDGSVAGVVPLVVRGAGRRRVALGPGERSLDFFAPACADDDIAAVAGAVLRSRAWDLWRLERCVAGGAWLEAVKSAAGPAGCAVRPWRAEDPLVASRLGDPAHGLDGKQRRELERLRRNLAAGHAVAVRESDGPDEARRDLAVLLDLHAARWGRETFTPSARAFHAGFAARAADRGWLRLHTLEVDGRPAAVLYGWRLGARAFAYAHAYDATYARHGVGISLMATAMERAAAEGCEWFDMLRGDEPYKQRFRPASVALESHLVAPRRSSAALEALARSGARRAWARLPARGRALVGRLRPR